ncbi:glycerol-3-phosphate dehydrogenase/oxidase [Sediminitomix flava]|uniref:Glycerol-3-phosphate dehydrogenase n=1 Tax=Sediminitomix flava TaxID=379075 RepID=A0A315Z5J9_SEDFL|nr:glycerol-3-phosphate dehydrogenase/oxidase [Sediminitomix flava]PWJ38416.1 glycerol-3-phosphate dehydrogenase [Sediminitomix flava]
MNREEQLQEIASLKEWDLIVIGGGATGLGCALDATMRGLKTLVVEQADFAKGTSSRSTKLIHGGVRYLEQGDVGLVQEALYERGLLKENAPHLVRNQRFVIPVYDWWYQPYYTIGLKVYDLMSGKLGLGPSESISKEETINAIPNIQQEGLSGGVVYYDGQFDDARLAITLAHSITDFGGNVINYMKVTGLSKDLKGYVNGVKVEDLEKGEEYHLNSKMVVNATGIFVDQINKMDLPDSHDIIKPSQGTHIVLDKSFLPSNDAIMVPKTDDGRVLFAVPWYNRVVVGTTDIPLKESQLEPRPKEEEVDFILSTAGKYLTKSPKRSDIKSYFAGIRPLVQPNKDVNTKEISRSHTILVSDSNLVTVTGGKWTTYRSMGEETIDKVLEVGNFPKLKCMTKNLLLHGFLKQGEDEGDLSPYGKDLQKIRALIEDDETLSDELGTEVKISKAEIVWATRFEMARKLEDVLARRTRVLFLDAQTAIDIAPKVADVMAKELKEGQPWIESQIKEFRTLALRYLPSVDLSEKEVSV